MDMYFPLGLEEEFQLIDSESYQLRPYIHPLLEKGISCFGNHIKAECFQSMVELITGIHQNISTLGDEVYTQRASLAHLVQDDSVALLSAGLHPTSAWQDQLITENERYYAIKDEQREVGRSNVYFGLHVHIGIQDQETMIALINQARTWLPHLLALSANSPFFEGRLTGFKAYRPILRARAFYRQGIPAIYSSWADLERYMDSLIAVGLIKGCRDIWWDIRPHLIYSTIEIRICDMPLTLEDTLSIAALCQALIAKLFWLHLRGKSVAILPREYIEENKWRAARDGMAATLINFSNARSISMCDAIGELLAFVEDVLDDLGSREQLQQLSAKLNQEPLTGADHQIAIYQQTGDFRQVIQFLMQQTMGNLSSTTSPPLPY
jgi:glutamate---cysteine ligase / carboxylate-amine ligase